MKNRFDTVIFDLDGTLIDSVPDVCANLNRVLQPQGARPLKVAEVKTMVQHGAMALAEKALAAVGFPVNEERKQETSNAFIASYKEHPAEYTVIFPGVLKVLETLTDMGVRMGICTNKPSATTFLVLDALDLRRFFTSVSCGDAQEFPKPDARHIRQTIQETGGNLDTAIMVGDSETDALVSRNAGVPVVMVSFGYSTVPVESLEADAIIDHFDDFMGVFDDLAQAKG